MQTPKSNFLAAFENFWNTWASAQRKLIVVICGIHGIYTEAKIWRGKGSAGGAQIDLIIDRRDNCINLCEIKFYEAPFSIDKKYAAALRAKMFAFKEETKTRKHLFLTFITCNGLLMNEHSTGLVEVQLLADRLFIPFRMES